MTVLKFRAINFDHRAGILHQRFRCGFHDASLTGTRWAEEQEVPNGTRGRRHPGQIHLIDVDNLLDGFILTDNHAAQVRF
jgi:hypothetical protein